MQSISHLSKAVALHARSLEILPTIEKFIATGTLCRGASFYARSKKLGGVVFDRLKSEYQFALMVPQDESEQLLDDNLHDFGCHVDRGFELLNLVEFTHPINGDHDREENLVRATIRNTLDNTEQVDRKSVV